ncbi:MAG: hypothetical protein LRY56_01665 [Burkholderiaceae bacterium]|nr:hypothetical protein [Burkholderiaceae bacterium]
MQPQPDSEQYLVSRLRENWRSRAIDREILAKNLILSHRQLQALEAADHSPFHTYGIYLRALRCALDDAQLLNDPEVSSCLQTLIHDYINTPPMTHVLQVKQTVNKKLGVAPALVKADQTSRLGTGLTIVLVVLSMLLTAVLLSLSLYM